MSNRNNNKFQLKDRSVAKVKLSTSTEQWTEKLWDELILKIYQAKSEEKIKRLLEKLISEDEKLMILKRLGIIPLIRSGRSYKEISEVLWLSPNTISTIKKNLLSNNKNYKSRLAFCGVTRKYGGDKIKIEKSFWEDFKDLFSDLDLWDIMKNPPRPVGIGLKRHQNKSRYH